MIVGFGVQHGFISHAGLGAELDVPGHIIAHALHTHQGYHVYIQQPLLAW
jgi:hypothetical protein